MFVFGSAWHSGAEPAVGHTPRIASEWKLSIEHSLLIHVRTGDTVRVDRGTVWLGADAPSRTVELCEGATHTVDSEGVLRMIGIDDPRVTVFSRSPVKVSAQADYGAWRHPSPASEGQALRPRPGLRTHPAKGLPTAILEGVLNR